MAVYGYGKRPSVVYWLDEKLYLNITNRCTNNCYFCLRRFKTGIAGFNLKLKEEPQSTEVIRNLLDMLSLRHWREIVFCGFGEPTTRLDTILEVAGWLSKNAFKPVRVNTNGQASLIYPKRDVVEELKKAGVNKLSVSLNAHDRTTYNKICKPRFKNSFDKILEFIECARAANLDVEVTAVAIPDIRVGEVEKIASEMRVKFRARPYSPCIW